MRIRRPNARQGYDLWSVTYDATPNPVVALDERVTPSLVRPKPGDCILDAGCGTGRYFSAIQRVDCELVGLDFSFGMLEVARRNYLDIPIVLADLQRPWPFRNSVFNVILCALVGEHLEHLSVVLGEMERVLQREGRVVFSVYHPAMAAAGIEANFRQNDIEYRLGAFQHSSKDYAEAFRQVGFRDVTVREFLGDEEIATAIPEARKYVGFPLLLVIQASKTDSDVVA